MPLKGKHFRHVNMPKPEVQPVFVAVMISISKFSIVSSLDVASFSLELKPAFEQFPRGLSPSEKALGGTAQRRVNAKKEIWK